MGFWSDICEFCGSSRSDTGSDMDDGDWFCNDCSTMNDGNCVDDDND